MVTIKKKKRNLGTRIFFYHTLFFIKLLGVLILLKFRSFFRQRNFLSARERER